VVPLQASCQWFPQAVFPLSPYSSADSFQMLYPGLNRGHDRRGDLKLRVQCLTSCVDCKSNTWDGKDGNFADPKVSAFFGLNAQFVHCRSPVVPTIPVKLGRVENYVPVLSSLEFSDLPTCSLNAQQFVRNAQLRMRQKDEDLILGSLRGGLIYCTI
jgi:hypothetical protein